ncbi:MAG TPA: glycosyltransferase family protein [bacterium]|nr:glycosyltransferase family protein [bacterium]HPN30401.1 glycosyltransferase family protein [bacterium]
MKISGIIQARTGSKRLPRKMLMEISGHKIIEWVIERVKLSRKLDEVILATSDKENDDVLARIAEEHRIKTFRGSENDVLNRYYECAKKFGADIVVRICADNPLISFELIDWTIDEHIKNNSEYTYSGSNEITKWPDGFGCEISSFAVLKKLEKINPSAAEREHVYQYIWNNQAVFKIFQFQASSEYMRPDIKLDVDYIRDFEFLKSFIEKNNLHFNSKMLEIIGFLNK